MKINLKEDDIKDLLGPSKKGSKGHLICNCPFCSKEGHFYIRYREDRDGWFYDCKKCGENGSSFRLLKHLGKLDEFIEETIDLFNLTVLKEKDTKEDEEEDIEVKSKKLPIGFTRIYQSEYLQSRHVQIQQFYKFTIGYTDLVSKLKDYVIFSIDEQGISKGYVARCLLPKKQLEEQKKLRYINSKGTNFGKLLFGIDELTDQTTTVILVEGVFDKIRLDNFLETDDSDDIKVLCTFGNKISKNQISKMMRYEELRNVIIFYDLDAIDMTKKYALALNKFFDNVTVSCLLDGKDPSDSEDYQITEALSKPYTPTEFLYEKVGLKKLKLD